MKEFTEISQPLAAMEVALPAHHYSQWADYLELTKPRMNFLVVITTAVGFYMAGQGGSQWLLLLPTLIGTALTASAASVFNQIQERKFDALMPRTRNRPMAAGRINLRRAVIFGLLLGVAGIFILGCWVNALTAALGAFTLGTYIFLYTPLKRISSLCTLIGAVPGAIPPMMGMTAVTGYLTMEAWVLFGILFIWQIPHFLAIAILYRDDYSAGGFKMLPCVDEGLQFTSRQIVIYSAALVPVSLLPSMLNMAGVYYFVSALLLGIGFWASGWICAASRSRSDARKLFLASIIYLPVLLAILMMDRI